ncbi:hypothetical protein, partial [Ralstonia pseudosolanacearum]|uniref:hypothetical protein n=1 Tax=Ralstonia pseudosolanacearum TaxID=1310165 RepID=UPI003221A4BA
MWQAGTGRQAVSDVMRRSKSMRQMRAVVACFEMRQPPGVRFGADACGWAEGDGMRRAGSPAR